MKHIHGWAVPLLLGGLGLLMAGLASGQPKEKVDFVGAEVCLGCHGEGYAKGWLKQPHGRFLMDPKRTFAGKGCEECHGPGSHHVEDPPGHILNPTKASAKEDNAACLKCHEKRIKKHDWQTSGHTAAKLRCSQCHKVHSSAQNTRLLAKDQTELCYDCHKQVKGQLVQNSHHPVREGKVACADCHDIHSGKHDGMLRREEKALCTTCHADVKGPFVYEHDPIVNGYTEPCTTCHRPHGSPNTRLLKFSGRGLCLSCHTSYAVSHFPGQTCWTCHSRVHGSNTDPNFLFE